MKQLYMRAVFSAGYAFCQIQLRQIEEHYSPNVASWRALFDASTIRRDSALNPLLLLINSNWKVTLVSLTMGNQSQ